MLNSSEQFFSSPWQQGSLLELAIVDLSDNGDGVGRWSGRVVFVPQTVVGDRALVRLVHVKPRYAYGKLFQLLEPSSERIRPHCIVADKCGGCQWQHISYPSQLVTKRNQVIQALERIGNLAPSIVAETISTGDSLGYRNKATYPLSRSSTGKVQAGYYRRGTHQIVNLNQCPVQDERLNPLLKEIKQDIEQKGWSIYDENHHRGKLRHLSLRIGRYTGEILLTLVSKEEKLSGIAQQAQVWLERYPHLVGVCLNHNSQRTNAIFGPQTHCLAGKPYLLEIFAGLHFRLRPETFFQVNTEAAEALLAVIKQRLNLQGNEVVVDAYCGIGTFALPLAKQVKQVIGIEIQPSAAAQARLNAKLNNIANAAFYDGKVEALLAQLDAIPDLILLDPPRKGCDRNTIETLRQIQPSRIVYISCKPATLARDLKLICQNDLYQLSYVQPVDFFPQTAHVECAAFLQHKSILSGRNNC